MEYKIDTLALAHEREERAAVKITEIEERCSVSSVSFIKANYGYVKIRDRKYEPEISFLIGVSMAKTAILLGLKGIDKLHQPDILNAIFRYFSDLTLEEIYKAFELERYGQYKEKTEHYQLFNAEYVTAILKKYRAYKQLIRNEHNILPGQSKQKELTQEEKDGIVKNTVNRIFTDFIETKILEEPTEYIFDFLVEKGKIKTKGSPALVEYYEKKLSEAKSELKKEMEKAESKSPAERKSLKVDLDKIISGQSPKIIIRAKKNILIEFFKKQIELNNQAIF